MSNNYKLTGPPVERMSSSDYAKATNTSPEKCEENINLATKIEKTKKIAPKKINKKNAKKTKQRKRKHN